MDGEIARTLAQCGADLFPPSEHSVCVWPCFGLVLQSLVSNPIDGVSSVVTVCRCVDEPYGIVTQRVMIGVSDRCVRVCVCH